MRKYVIINGVNSLTITGLAINELPAISKPPMRVYQEEIDGRDGDIVTNLGYSAYDKEVSIGLYGSYDVDEVIKYFSDNSKGQVTFSNEPDKYYNYEIINQIDFERLIRFKTAIVTLHCQPFKYPVNETPVEIAYQYVTNEAEEMDLDNTADAPMNIDLKGNTSQASDPTPDSPVDVNVVSGDNTIKIHKKNMFNASLLSGTYGSCTYTIGDNGLITQSASDTSTFYLSQNRNFILGAGTYTISIVDKWTDCHLQVRNLLDGENLVSTTSNSATFTLTEEKIVAVKCYGGSNYPHSYYIQLESGNEATEFEAYIGQNQLISLGAKNLFDKNSFTSKDGYIKNDSGTETSSANFSYSTSYTSVLPDTIYTLTGDLVSSNRNARVYFYDSSKTWVSRTGAFGDGNNICTFKTPSNCYYIQFQYATADFDIDTIQITKGLLPSRVSTTPIELNKIGTYKDRIFKAENGDEYYDSLTQEQKALLTYDKRYLHKEIGKVVLDGDTNKVTLYGNYGDDNKPLFYMNKSDMVIPSAYTETILMSDNYTQYTGSTPQPMANNQIRGATSTGRIYLRDDRFTTASDFNTQLQNSNVLINYVLATPTNTEITDTTLISQLEDLKSAYSYQGQTNISQENNDKPFIISASALQDGTDKATINNIGNVYSKPTIDIEGTGDVNVYIDNNQIFNVNVDEEVIIDSTNLEAYKPNGTLANRSVTGNISNFKLPTGNSVVKVEGNYTTATITNYVRYL